MRILRVGVAAACLAGPVLLGQAAERAEQGGVTRIFYVAHAPEVPQFQEMANAVRAVGDIKGVFSYSAGRAIIVRGTSAEAGMAGWLIQALDRSAGQGPFTGQYASSANDVVRVFQVNNAKSTQEIQEIANTVRTIAEIRHVFVYSPSRMVAIRGTPDDLAMAAWLFTEMDKPAPSVPDAVSSVPEYRVPGAADDIVRVYRLTDPPSNQDFQEELNALRATTEIRRMFSYSGQRAVAMRGTADQLGLAEFLMKGLAARQ